MLVLMLDPRFKSMRLVVNYLNCEPTSALVKEYDVHLKNFVGAMLQGDDPFFAGGGSSNVGRSR